jgi:hypothetical protein
MNSEANVQNDNVNAITAVLSKKERSSLSKAVLGHGKMKQAVALTGISKDTIAKAKAGMDIKPETADKIRTFLNTL